MTVHAKTLKLAKQFVELRADFASPIFILHLLQISCGLPVPLLKYGSFYTALTDISLL